MYRIDVHTNVSKEAQALSDRPIPRLNRSDVSLYDMMRFSSVALAISAAGKTKVAPTTIYCKPKWRKGKIGIVIEDLGKPALVNDDYGPAIALGVRVLAMYPASAVVDTFDRLPQVFYIFDMKYEKEFYDAFMKWLNAKWGDPQVTRQGWDTRVAGLYNKKDFMRDGSGRTPMCRLRCGSTRYPIEMERLADEYRPIWEAEQRERPKPEPVSVPAGEYSVPASALGGDEYGPKSREAFRAELERAFCDESSRAEGFKVACALLEEVEIPDYVFRTGQACEKYELKKWAEKNTGQRTDRSDVDAATARVLYSVGATPYEVYSYMLPYACQDESWIELDDGRHQRVKSPADRDHKARWCALNLAPESCSGMAGGHGIPIRSTPIFWPVRCAGLMTSITEG